jgi:hypothetical protein
MVLFCSALVSRPSLPAPIAETPSAIKSPFRLAWARYFEGERLGTAMEPVLGGGRVFVATHQGNLYALDAATGNPLWRVSSGSPFLHSPAYSDGMACAANVEGNLLCVDANKGKLKFASKAGSFSASPVMDHYGIYVGSRTGQFLAFNRSGRLLWKRDLHAPIRQTALVVGRRVYVTSDDLRVHGLDAATGKLLWVSEPLSGQTARDNPPVYVKAGTKNYLVVRTNPVQNMAQRIAEDRHLLSVQAGVDDSDWRKIDAWIKSDEARGNPELWEREQQAVIRHLQIHPDTQTFFVLDAETGKRAAIPPVLWAAGCQGVGTPPVALPDGRLFVFYRSAYGNWNHGVAPLVALGILVVRKNRITPLFHNRGQQPPWNTFWGTADESENFTLAGDLILISHQGTLSGFNLQTGDLSPIWGERDTYGGFRNLPWARNEWHGPARSRAVVSGKRIYWQTGSRILCVVSGEDGKPAEPVGIRVASVPGITLLSRSASDKTGLRKRLQAQVAEILSRRWSPLYVEPGLSGREFFFENSGDLFQALALSYPFLSDEIKKRVKVRLAEEWENHRPYIMDAGYPLTAGARREYFPLPKSLLTRLGSDRPPLPFGNLYSVWLYATRCGEWPRVLASWSEIKASFRSFMATGWKLDGAKGDRYANRYLASLIAFGKIAERAGDREAATQARNLADSTTKELIRWWRRAAEEARLPVFNGSGDLDRFIGNGGGVFFEVHPHQSKLALFSDLTPEVASLIRSKAPESVSSVWSAFEALCPTWYVTGEERQVHFGENDVDPPDFALSAFRAMAWLRNASAATLAQRADLPFCRADLEYVEKCAICLMRANPQPP